MIAKLMRATLELIMIFDFLGVQELKFKRWLMAIAMASFAIVLLGSSLVAL
jgi:hypothetical protein